MEPYSILFSVLFLMFVFGFLYLMYTSPHEGDNILVMKAVNATFPDSSVESITQYLAKASSGRKLPKRTVQFLLDQLRREGYVVPFIKESDKSIFWAVVKNWDEKGKIKSEEPFVAYNEVLHQYPQMF